MQPEDTQRLIAQFACLGEYYRQHLSDNVCTFYAQDLSDLEYRDVLGALRRMRLDGKRRFVPMPAEVRDMVTSAKGGADNATDLAAKIASAISRFGYPNGGKAEAFIGPVGWSVVERLGGWQPLCQSLTTDKMQTFYAQTREMCRTALSDAAMRNPQPMGPLIEAQLTNLLARC